MWVLNFQAITNVFAAQSCPLYPSNISFIPPSEADAIFNMVDRKGKSTKKRITAGNWVTVRVGKYRGDFGLIRKAKPDGNLRVYVVPQIFDSTVSPSRQGRPPQHILTVEWLKIAFPHKNIEEYSSSHFKFRNGHYRHGLRVLNLSPSNLDVAFPSINDLFPFKHIHLGDLEDAEYYVRSGDVVAVLHGELQGLVGTVTECIESSVVLSRIR